MDHGNMDHSHMDHGDMDMGSKCSMNVRCSPFLNLPGLLTPADDLHLVVEEPLHHL